MPSWAGAMMDHFDAKFNLLIDGYTGLDQRITELDKKLSNRIDSLEETMNVIFKESDYKFEVLFEKLGGLEKRKVNREELTALELRLGPKKNLV